MSTEQDTTELYQFLLEVLPQATAARRARICRALANIIGSSDFARVLLEESEQCEAIERAHLQLVLDFRRKGL